MHTSFAGYGAPRPPERMICPVEIRYSGSAAEATNHQLLVNARSLADEAVLGDLVGRQPQLLNGYVVAAELDTIPRRHRRPRRREWAVLALLEQANFYYQGAPEQFPIGVGPLERVHQDVVRGYVSPPAAHQAVSAPEFVWSLGGAYLRALNRSCVAAMQDEGQIRQAWVLQELALSAVSGLPDMVVADSGVQGHQLQSALDFMHDETVGDWLLAALSYLPSIPDGRVYRRAQAIAPIAVQRLLATGRDDDREQAGRFMFRLAGLGLDPYAGLPLDQARAHPLLRSRVTHHLGEDVPEDAVMPPYGESLSRSEGQFRTAIQLASGDLQGRAYKALFDCLINRRQLGADVTDAELRDVANEALSAMDPIANQHHFASIRTMAKQVGLALEATPTPPVSIVPTPEMTPATTSGTTEGRAPTPTTPVRYAAQRRVRFDGARLAAVELADTDPETALDALVSLEEDAATLGAEAREKLWKSQADVLRAHADSDRPALADLGRRLTMLDELLRTDREQDAAHVLLEWEVRWAELTDRQPPTELVRSRIMGMAANAAVNFIHVDPASAVRWYGAALDDALSLNPVMATDMVTRLGWLARDHRHLDVCHALCEVLTRHARAWYAVGDPTRTALHRTVQHALATALLGSDIGSDASPDAQESPDEDVVDRLRQLLKGLGYAVAVQDGARYKPDSEDAITLEEIAALTPGTALVEESSSALFAEDLLLTTYTAPSEIRAGASASERLANMQRAFDARVFSALTSGTTATKDDHRWLESHKVREHLDERTVLLDIVTGIDYDERLVIHVLVSTRDSTRLSSHPNPDRPGFAVRSRTGEVLVHPLADDVRRLRQALDEHPGLGRDVAREAQEALLDIGQRVLGPGDLARALQRLHASGYDHLLVVPHGPLHYVPFHLLPLGNGIVADRFTVTVLPNRALLTGRRGDSTTFARERQAGTGAIGLTFANGVPFDLPPLPDSAPEVTEVAARFQAVPLLDEAATEAAVLDCLKDRRYVHVSTHGRNTSAGAAFQLLYLWPDPDAAGGGSDGRLYAFELLDTDLSGLEVLTLSACETALGRFDLMDDVRGIPASVLLRGASAVVGTLWEAEPTASRAFFRTFYVFLSEHPGEVRAAFRHAQLATRAAHPHYRDWGAFYLLGVT